MVARKSVAFVVLVGVVMLLIGAAPAMAGTAKDSNHNGIPNWWESKYHLSTKANQANCDFDKDGLSNLNEFRASTNPRVKDSDHDGVKDGVEDRDKDGLVNVAEVRAHTSIRVADTDHDGTIDTDEDPDKDALDNADEWDCRTNPLSADSDKDGVTDANEDADCDGLDNEAECAQGCDPRDSDSDNDGEKDCDEIGGVITGFDATSGILTITPFKDGAAPVQISIDGTTTLSWDDDEDEATAPTLADLQIGVTIHEAEVAVQTDGSLLASHLELARAEEGKHNLIAEVESFDAVSGELVLDSEADEDCEFAVLVDPTTVFAWADGIVADHAAGPADLVEDAGVSALVTSQDVDGSVHVTSITLVPASDCEDDD